MNKKQRIVKGIADSYLVRETLDSVSGEPFLEVYEAVTAGNDEHYEGDWLCDIDATIEDTDDYILGEIDAAL